MADSSETQQDAELKKYISRYSLLQWMRIFDRMREERYKFYCPEREFLKLEEILRIRKGLPEVDRAYLPLSYTDRAFFRVIEDDVIRKWTINSGVDPNDQPTPARRMNGETWSERYPDVHGKKSIPVSDVTKRDYSEVMSDHEYWGRIIPKIIDAFHFFNGRVFGAFPFRIVGRRCRQQNHDGITPVTWTEVDYSEELGNPPEFGSFQIIGNDRNGYYVFNTYVYQLQIQDFEPPCDGPYYIAVVGMTADSYQFDGLGVAEYPGVFNVLFEDGPIEGKYTSPLIGPGTLWITPDLNDFANNTQNKDLSGGCRIERTYLLITPADGFRDHYIPDGK